MVVGLQSRPEAAWVDIGVDDLTKYRIVEYLYQRLGHIAEVSLLAAALGFHSLEQTTCALDELARRGVVWIERPPDGPARCGCAADLALRATITRLLALNQAPGEAAALLERLARRSLARVQTRQQGRRRVVDRGARRATAEFPEHLRLPGDAEERPKAAGPTSPSGDLRQVALPSLS